MRSACNLAFRNKKQVQEQRIENDDSYDERNHEGQSIIFSLIKPNYDIYMDISIRLTEEEAQFLKEKILSAEQSKHTLLSFLIENNICVDSLNDIPLPSLPTKIYNDFMLAMEFARFINGAHIRYNCIFSKYTDEKMITRFDSWMKKIQENPVDLDKILSRVNTNDGLRKFCMSFYESVNDRDLSKMDKLIIQREKMIKGNRSKLNKPTEYAYDPDRAIHDFVLDYRYNTAKIIIDDIITGLEKIDV